MLDAEQPQDCQVLVRLRSRPLGCVDHEQEKVDAGRAGHHVADEALVSRHVHERQVQAPRKLERRVAEVDRDPALVLFGQPVGVLSGQGAHKPRLAVVDVAGGPDYERHRASINRSPNRTTPPYRPMQLKRPATVNAQNAV